MGYRCDRCNLEFTDFEQYLDHECKCYNATQMTYNEARTLENLFYRIKNGNESHIGNIPVYKEMKKFLMTDTALEVGSLDFESDDYGSNQLCSETLNETVTSLTSFEDLDSYHRVQFNANQTNPQVNFNPTSIPLGKRQMNESNSQINTRPLSVSLEMNPKQFFNCAMNPCHNTNQDYLSAEYGQMPYNMRQMNPELSKYQPFVSFEYSPLDYVSYESNQDRNTNQQKVSPHDNEVEFYPRVENQKFHHSFKKYEYSHIELERHERNPQFDTNRKAVLSEYKQIDYCNIERIPQIDTNQQMVTSEDGKVKLGRLENNPHFGTNQLTVSSEYSQMEYYNKEKNLQCKSKQRMGSSEDGEMKFRRLENIPQFDTNKRSVSNEYNEIEYCTKYVNPQFNANLRTVTNEYEIDSFMGISPSQQLSRLHEADIEHCENFKKKEQNLDCVKNFIKGGMNYTNPKSLQQMDANISSITQNVVQAETFYKNTFLLNSLYNKNPKVFSKRPTPKEYEYSRQSELSRKSNIKANYRFHTGEKPYECDKCKMEFSYKSHQKRHDLVYTSEKV
ncbi:hypothetical protein TNIN_312791 [Trichonephila inaurata madagascariensis]|uniref:C2H2-type domain-containing protein n=1 Tax=Trichonephila inaurata madagascariensis TaxID=2747483 RepID=A0A8X7CP59_9ARAC|nr:hypothetical protein TNIN_312791 [Trichonephila inaurata madagascariensis]